MKLSNCNGFIDYLNVEEYENINIGIELQDFTQPELLDGDYMSRVDSYQEKLKEFKNTISIHGPFLDLKPASPDMEIRRVTKDKYKKAIISANKLNAEYIVFHSQINPWINEPFMRNLNNEMQRDFWIELLNEIEYNGTIVIENVFEDNPLYIKELIEKINMDNIKICLDIGHSKLHSNSKLEDWISELKDHIAYVHLHWNNGEYDYHDYPSDENLKYIFDLFKKYNINPRYAMEYEVKNIESEYERLVKIGGIKNG